MTAEREALDEAWRALDLAPADMNAKRLISRLLRRDPDLISTERQPDLERLFTDPDVDPDAIASAGWTLLLAEAALNPGGEPKAMADALEKEPLALLLLTEACMCSIDAERALTAVRRWVLLTASWAKYPRLAQALVAQAARNGGAWPFDDEERAVLRQTPDLAFASAYLPPPPVPARGLFSDADTQALADEYARWPYPVWSRFTPPEPTTLPHTIQKLDGGRPSGLPVDAEILVAGCGTGREAAMMAKRFPDARVTAIDISASSLAYAAEHCADLGIDFRLLDLQDVAELGQRFDLVASSGVLHHLPDPEGRWAKLVEVLKPGGVMKVMLYSRVARLRLAAAKTYISDLLEQPVDDDLLRAVRRRLIEKASGFVGGSLDFYSLGGVRDLLLNSHEVLFDVPRIVRALDRLRLELLAFKLPTSADEARYRSDHPDDPLFRDTRVWGELEKTDPFLFSGMYEFWCRSET
jgi:SAM-dependent methyltransferase